MSGSKVSASILMVSVLALAIIRVRSDNWRSVCRDHHDLHPSGGRERHAREVEAATARRVTPRLPPGRRQSWCGCEPVAQRLARERSRRHSGATISPLMFRLPGDWRSAAARDPVGIRTGGEIRISNFSGSCPCPSGFPTVLPTLPWHAWSSMPRRIFLLSAKLPGGKTAREAF